ncbi:helicase [Helicobacter bizzozeronii]|uniref:NYN domain-containing protein n=1 Tax=Helicobacter bizzozeronii TaxID=56877 RepID=UPI00244D8321|nr:NYN domain-containing protein [Helicobacter bizzozeronii]GMB93860.1 helicase [Helicobacter bizzozeronii]
MQNETDSQFFDVHLPKKTAVLVDLSFFLKVCYSKLQDYPQPTELAEEIRKYVLRTLGASKDYLFRVFVYDCEPVSGRTQQPISKKQLSLDQDDVAQYRTELLKMLKQKPYFSVRLGRLHLDKRNKWVLNPEVLKKLLSGKKSVKDLKDEDFQLNLRQKMVDMKIGLDIASLAIKKQAEKVVLITNDSDFVPAIKFAKQEGMIVQLDPLRQDVAEDLSPHIDLLRSVST